MSNQNYDDDFVFFTGSNNDDFVDISHGKAEPIETEKTVQPAVGRRKKQDRARKPAQTDENLDKTTVFVPEKENGGEVEVVDIYSSNSGNRFEDDDLAEKPRGKKKGGSKSKVAVIVSVAVVLAAALGVTGFVLLNNVFSKPAEANQDDVADSEFTFKTNTYVSGVSIGGKSIEQAKKLLEMSKDKLVGPLSLSVDVEGDIIELTQADFEYSYNIDEVLEQAKRDAENDSFTQSTDPSAGVTYEVTATVKQESVKSAAQAIAKDVDKEAKNASVSKFNPYADDRFEYTEATTGKKLDADGLFQKLSDVFKSGASEYRVIADVETVEAEIQVDDIKKNVKKLSTYSTVSYNTANGTSNMKISLEACNGSIIDPGETWSFNGCTGDSNLTSNGYKPAHVIVDGKIKDGIGGGICQSSSTIYNAAVRADMTIVERYNHKWASSYVPTGLDATIDYPGLDLKLSNPTKYQMFLECKVVGSTLYASIWGVKSDSYDFIKTHNEITDQSKSSYSVKAWRIYYKDGKEVDRESLGSSTYDMENGVVFIDADSDYNDADKDVDDLTDPVATEPPATEKATEAPKTDAPTKAPETEEPKTEAPVVTEPEVTEPVVTEPEETEPVVTDPVTEAPDETEG